MRHPPYLAFNRTLYGARWMSVTGAAVFILLMLLVQTQVFRDVDVAVASMPRAIASQFWDMVSAVASWIFSAELSLVYAGVLSMILWRNGVGRWSLAPFVFVALIPLEIGLKLTIAQPPVPAEFHREVAYPFLSLPLQGTFPSGHAIRTGFFCTFVAAMVWSRGGLGARWIPFGVGSLALLVGFTRLYLGHHWLSDVVAGLALGASVAIAVATPVVERLAARRTPGEATRQAHL